VEAVEGEPLPNATESIDIMARIREIAHIENRIPFTFIYYMMIFQLWVLNGRNSRSKTV
jgi:hypothetical protein